MLMTRGQIASRQWDVDRWPNFKPIELSCKHCGEYYHDPKVLDALQAVRRNVDRPLIINSAHRCALHNVRSGGAPFSQHLKIAVDIDLRGHDKKKLVGAAKKAGFTGFGYAASFLHLDMGRARSWFYGPISRKVWS